ncbi:pRiA4b ORF-3-like protein [Saccharicrinis carchari]|uniref:PRiA4b ORF-3-like protein n=1 Tax=Saccharicrinis carchari TaxID=1168039 RepID=A0A521ERS5_SACCC|nr:plasmid pRiA4b ORF-3 family protein [Saccharicrinis carchari]SMO86121.1 pRiA4b ORF-3-like protein [Saccharicrinis carchari]
MTIRLRIISAEDDDFLREIEISGDATFLELHHFIQKTLNFDPSQMASFFTTDDAWHKDKEITLMDMAIEESDASLIMSETTLKQLLSDKKQRMIYTFDFFNDRNLFIEMDKISHSECPKPKCTQEKGNAPEQLDMSSLLEATMGESSATKKNLPYDDDFGDDDDFNDPLISYTDDLDDY